MWIIDLVFKPWIYLTGQGYLVEELIKYGVTVSVEEYIQYNGNMSEFMRDIDNLNEEPCGKLFYDGDKNLVMSFIYFIN